MGEQFLDLKSMMVSDLEAILAIGTDGSRGGVNLSAALCLFCAIETVSQFYSNTGNSEKIVQKYVNQFFDDYYKQSPLTTDLVNIYRHGLAHYYLPKSNASILMYEEEGKVVSLEKFRSFNRARFREYKVYETGYRSLAIQVLYLDFKDSIRMFEDYINSDQENFLRCANSFYDKLK
ncbi:hypothetical protein KKE34_05695 [Patescibacteria group bacterium]|nr:hypothetical protein [Patescibacteria group bacterium]